MAKSLYFVFCVVWMFAFLCAVTQTAYAYVDPGSGLLLYQVTGSLLTAALVLLRRQVRRLFGLLGRMPWKGRESASR